MPGNKKPRKPKKKRPPQKQMTYGAGAGGPDDGEDGQQSGKGRGAKGDTSPARISRGAARGG